MTDLNSHPQSLRIAEEIQKELGSTNFACSSLDPLSGGLANFVFKGRLAHPLPDGSQEVAVKHGEGYVAGMPDWKITTDRCVSRTPSCNHHRDPPLTRGRQHIEEACLKAVSGMPGTPSGPCVVRTPKLYHFNDNTNTQVQELLHNTISLKDYALKYFSSPSNDSSTKLLCLDIGKSLGLWLKNFHRWTSQPEQSDLRSVLRGNESIQSLRHKANYSNLLADADTYSEILADAKEVFAQVEKMATEELQRSDLEVIHGDFWTGK